LALVCVGWAKKVPADVPAGEEGIQKLFATLCFPEMMQNLMTTSMPQ
jgi:hypothetical protein